MQSPDESQHGCLGPSLWSLIVEHVAGSELPKIRAALGDSLVDMYTEVHAEVEMWHKMWQESQRGGNHGSRAGTPLTRQQRSPLADPPVVKELVRAEVKMLLETLRERVSRGGRDGEELLFHYNPETVKYALGHLDSCYSNCIDSGDPDNESRLNSRCSVQSNAEDEIEAVRNELNVTDIHQVVDRLKSVLMEECEVLNRLVKQIRRDIKQKCRSQCEIYKSEPTLAELRELRGAIQVDLELYPSPFAASSPASSPLPAKGQKNRSRLSAGPQASSETLQALNGTSVPIPHPLPALCHPKPRPPAGPPLTNTSSSVSPIHSSSLTKTYAQHRGTLVSNRLSKTPICNMITTSGHVNHLSTDQQMVKTEHFGSLPSEQDSAGLLCRPPTSSHSFQIKIKRNSSTHEAHLSSRGTVRSLSKEHDLSPQRERKSGSVWRSRKININSSPVPSLSSLCDAVSCSSSDTDRPQSTTGRSETQNGQKKSSSGGCLVSATMQGDNERRRSTSKSFHSSVMYKNGGCPAKTDQRSSNSRTDRNENDYLEKDFTQQQSFCTHSLSDHASHHSESSGRQGQTKRTVPVSIRIKGQFFPSSKTPLGGARSQLKSVQPTQTFFPVSASCKSTSLMSVSDKMH